ncbi:hypothetical protein J1605_001331 [Eschrichtius robustus]|uniref:Xrn1 helical domain-containing protein n=1 Tax=Eschrichtius robustus TaxID=9764 RepID=A0AB34G9N8_ESCRO|nr:hypothetical protein J1605_001331 [Eschrichtius robustus]
MRSPRTTMKSSPHSPHLVLFYRFYPYHYAPFLSDIRNISTLKIHFELGKPFKPFEQLLAVLPAASKNLLPTCYQSVENIASSVLGKSLFVNWPHLEEARVVGVSDGETK